MQDQNCLVMNARGFGVLGNSVATEFWFPERQRPAGGIPTEAETQQVVGSQRRRRRCGLSCLHGCQACHGVWCWRRRGDRVGGRATWCSCNQRLELLR
ncbi:hypothetical protein MUK42_30789 [Musa troglodytarum]|uniref:Uncharacterized protein n=1 Tax=Musa troglodytarum TaxID=320322 RepID=A0A9E7FQ88_9LILI|nr:hypothetical protein MUK42_30789 [Musa troglodytarum]